MDTTKRSPLDRLLFATFLKGRTSSRDIWEEKGEMCIRDSAGTACNSAAAGGNYAPDPGCAVRSRGRV